MTEDGWFYAEGETPVGPVKCETLVRLLRMVSDPGKVKVWRTGFPDWRDAKDVPEIFDQVSRPPPLSGRRPERPPGLVGDAQLSEKKNEPKSGWKNTRGRVALLLALAIALCVGAIFSTVIYNNSAEGIAFLAGEFTGPAFFLFALMWSVSRVWRQRPSTYTAAVVVVIAAVTVGLSNWQKLQDGIAAREATTALKDVRDPGATEQALKRNPSNTLLQLTAAVVKEAQETHRLAQKLSDEIEPPSLAKDIDYAKTTRAELEAYVRDLKTAEANATAAIPRYLALLNDERSRVEAFARSLQVDKGLVRSALSGTDKRHDRAADLTSRMLIVRAELYRTLGNAVAIVVEQFDNYKVDATGRFIFSSQRIADRYNAASSEVDAPAKRLNELKEEGKRLAQFQQEGWERFVSSE
jgi:hypothetical protein